MYNAFIDRMVHRRRGGSHGNDRNAAYNPQRAENQAVRQSSQYAENFVVVIKKLIHMPSIPV